MHLRPKVSSVFRVHLIGRVSTISVLVANRSARPLRNTPAWSSWYIHTRLCKMQVPIPDSPHLAASSPLPKRFSVDCHSPCLMHLMPRCLLCSVCTFALVAPTPPYRNHSLHHCSFQTTVTFDMAELSQFQCYNAAHEPVFSNVLIPQNVRILHLSAPQ
ncbi:hypothetical protein BsWGS_27320 [Bradybaena similaris]